MLKVYTNTEIIDYLQDLYQRKGSTKSEAIINDNNGCSISTIIDRFGGLYKARKKAGVPVKEKYNKGNILSDKFIINYLKKLYKEEGDITQKIIDNDYQGCCYNTVIRRIGKLKEIRPKIKEMVLCQEE